VADALLDAGALAVALAGIVGFVVLVARLRPVRWLWRTLIADPIGDSFDRRTRAIVTDVVTVVVEEKVAPIREQFGTNGGSTLRDRINVIDERSQATGEIADALNDRLSALEARSLTEGA
jgi:hypothetical protein